MLPMIYNYIYLVEIYIVQLNLFRLCKIQTIKKNDLTTAIDITYCKPTFIHDDFILQSRSWWLMFGTKPYPDWCCYNNHTTRTGLWQEIFCNNDALTNLAKNFHTQIKAVLQLSLWNTLIDFSRRYNMAFITST